MVKESVKKVLKEYYSDTWFNPGNVKNPRVAKLGNIASTQVRGNVCKNDCDWEVMRKHDGGDKPLYGIMDIFQDAKRGDENAMKKFFAFLKHNKDVWLSISKVIYDFQEKAQEKRMNRGAAEE